jgi:fermentation-respiration switch protein FrsA (DUF1100 family)
MDSTGPGLLRIIAGAALLGAFAYLALLALVYTQQRRLLFPASPVRVTAGQAGLPDIRDVEISTADGERLVGWWKAPAPGRALILYFHGNGGSLLNRRDRVRLLTRDGRGILMISYRGYSGSTGSPSEAGLREDARAARDWLRSYGPERIVLYGESLGTGVAVRLATERTVGGVILDAPYTSTADIAKGLFWYLPVALLMRDQFRSVDLIGDIGVPLLMMHGEADAVVPIALSELLFKAAKEPKRYLRLPGVDHVSVLESGGIDAVRSFLDAIEARLPPEAKPQADPQAEPLSGRG